jgi:hypothetical protein
MEGAIMTDDTQVVPDPVAQAAQDPQPSNVLEQLAAKRGVIADTREAFIPLPGYDKEPPLLLAKYRLIDGPELAQIGSDIQTEFRSRWDRSLYMAIATMVRACGGIYVDIAGDGNPVPLTLNGKPITGYNDDLAEALSFQDKLPPNHRDRDVLVGLFGGNEVMISSHAIILNRWFADTSLDISKEMLEGNF